MDEFPSEQDAQRELSDLRARAYGSHADIADDPVALARLAELEGAQLTHTAVAHDSAALQASAGAPAAIEPVSYGAPVVEDAEVLVASADRWLRSPSPPPSAAWPRLVLAAVAGLAAVLVIASAVAGIVGPHPDATLGPTGVEPDDDVAWRFGPDALIDESALRGYASYRGLEPWVAMNADGDRCLLLNERSRRNVVQLSCAPDGAQPVAELGVWPGDQTGFGQGLPVGTVIRFRVIGDAVHVFVYPGPVTD